MPVNTQDLENTIRAMQLYRNAAERQLAASLEREQLLREALERIAHKANDPDITEIALTALK